MMKNVTPDCQTQNLRIFGPNPPLASYSESYSDEFLAFRCWLPPRAVKSSGGCSVPRMLSVKSCQNPRFNLLDSISVSSCKGKFPRKRVRKEKQWMVISIGRLSREETFDWKGIESKPKKFRNLREKSQSLGCWGRFVGLWRRSAWWSRYGRGGGGGSHLASCPAMFPMSPTWGLLLRPPVCSTGLSRWRWCGPV